MHYSDCSLNHKRVLVISTTKKCYNTRFAVQTSLNQFGIQMMIENSIYVMIQRSSLADCVAERVLNSFGSISSFFEKEKKYDILIHRESDEHHTVDRTTFGEYYTGGSLINNERVYHTA